MNLVFLSSPQAIFKDPFRGGNNILVSDTMFKELNIVADRTRSLLVYYMYSNLNGSLIEVQTIVSIIISYI